VLNQTGQLRNIVKWVADADEQIQTIYSDWDFLWSQFTINTISGVSIYTAPSNLASWDDESFFLDYDTGSHCKLSKMVYKEWRSGLRQGVNTNDRPSLVVVLPNKNLLLVKTPDSVYNLTADYWKSPLRLSANTEVSLIPTSFERAIISRAKMFVFDDTGDREQYAAAATEFQVILQMLEAHSLPARSHATKTDYVDLRVRLS
jgi:hypothetical protein